MSIFSSILGMFNVESLLITLFTLPFLIFSLSVHEYAHGYIAMKMGDYTAKAHGRLTLNPIAHIDPLGLIALVLFKFGWAKPVPVNPYNFTNRKKGYILVSLAGPISNLILTVGFTVVYLLFLLLVPANILFSGNMAIYYVRQVFSYAMSINIVLAIFNLIPIPPLDGSKILEALLPYKYLIKVERFLNKGQFVIFILFIILMRIGILDGLFDFVLGGYFRLLNPIINTILLLKF